MNSLKLYQHVVASLLNQSRPAAILDAPSGNGWLRPLLSFDTQIDGLDLFAPFPGGYRIFRKVDLDLGLPDDLGVYDAIVCCEGIEHFGNPNIFFKSARRHLAPGGRLIVTTPNVWLPEARLQFFLRGFFPSFPCLVGRIERGTHMHIMPWSFPQLFLFLRLNGFEDIILHDIEERKPKRMYERVLGIPQAFYCRHKRNKSLTEEERTFWSFARSEQSIYGRSLVVSAATPNPAVNTDAAR
jgi:SAM-dependent methyltransferase